MPVFFFWKKNNLVCEFAHQCANKKTGGGGDYQLNMLGHFIKKHTKQNEIKSYLYPRIKALLFVLLHRRRTLNVQKFKYLTFFPQNQVKQPVCFFWICLKFLSSKISELQSSFSLSLRTFFVKYSSWRSKLQNLFTLEVLGDRILLVQESVRRQKNLL